MKDLRTSDKATTPTLNNAIKDKSDENIKIMPRTPNLLCDQTNYKEKQMITNQEMWDRCVEQNKDPKDPYGKCCVDVARKVMEILDKDEPYNCRQIICDADDAIKAGGITRFMAGVVASMVSDCHSRGGDFRKRWNDNIQINQEGDEATRQGKTLNPALLLSIEK